MHKLFFAFILLCACPSLAQLTITGKVLDNNVLPLEGCHVHIGSKSTETDAKGNYKISKLSKGKLNIVVTFIGFKSIDTIVQVNNNGVFDFKLTPKTESLEEVQVKHKGNSYNHSVLEQKIKLNIIERMSNQSLGTVLKELSGVSVLKTGATIVKPVLQGLHSSRVPIFTNNVKLEDQQWGIEHAPNFDVNAAGKITVIKGASGLQYSGDAIGGLVIIEPYSVNKDTLFGKSIITLESNGRGGTLSSSLHKGNFCDWSWNTQGSFKYLGDRQSPVYTLSNTGNREVNFSGDVKYIGKKYDFSGYYSIYNATIGILAASHIGNVTDLYNSIIRLQPDSTAPFTYDINNPKQQVQHHLAKLNYNYYLSPYSKLSLQYAFQFNNRKEFDIRRSSRDKRAALDLDLTSHIVNLDYKVSSKIFDLKTGLLGMYQKNIASPATEIRPLVPNYTKYDGAVYGIVDTHLTESLAMEMGIRYEYSNVNAAKFYLKSRWNERQYSPQFDSFIVSDEATQWFTQPTYIFHNFSSSLGFQYSFEKELDVYLTFSRAVRNPNITELFSDGLHHSSGMIELGDLKLNQEKSNKVATSIIKKWEKFSFTANPFLNYITDYMFLKPVGFETTIRGAFPVWEYAQTNALMTGIDVDAKWEFYSNWKHIFSFSYVKATDTDFDIPVIDMPPINIDNSIQFHKKEWNELTIELKSEIIFRQHDVPNNDFVTNIVDSGVLVPVVVPISRAPAGYHLLHLYSDVRCNLSKKSFLTIAFSVFNMFNTNYRDYLNRQRFYVDELGRNFQLQLKINY
jgi:iron complex outermembrane receptor protein